MAYEQDTMVCDLGPQFGGKRKVDKLVEAFEAYWARLQHHQPGWPNNSVEQAFDHALKCWLRFHRAMLVGEVIPLALDFVLANPGHPDIPLYEHVLVVAGIMPSIDDKDPPAEQERQRQEQRRLFYVGITRSTETLVINNSIRMPYAAAFLMRMPVLARAGVYAILQASPMLPELGPTAPPVTPAAAWRAQLGF